MGAQRMNASAQNSTKAPLTRQRAARWILHVFLLVVAALMAAPLVWLFTTSLTRGDSAFTTPPSWWPNPFTFENFVSVADLIPIGRMFLNSLTVTAITVVGSLFLASMAAYAFSRIQFRGSGPLFLLLLSAMMVPGQLTVIPIFIMMRNLGLIDTLTALWLPALINVFAIFFLRQYFNSIPRELDDAARIDGAGHLRILFQIMLPLAVPALSALAILGFESAWNNYFGPLIFLSSPERMTLPIGLVSLSAGIGGNSEVVVFAGIAIVVLPMLILFLVFQRAFVESIATIGIRG